MSRTPSSRPTQRDIAELAGVSITTVSHVVNGTRSVAPETRSAVLEAVEATGYTGDAIARSLVTGGTGSLGLALAPRAVPHFAGLLEAIEREAAHAGYALLFADTRDDVNTERDRVRSLLARRIDGLLLTPADGDPAVLHGPALPETPVVVMERLSNRGDVDQVGTENIQAASTLTEHLASHGHRRIGLVSGTEGTPTGDERTLGYRLGLGRAGLPWDPDLIAAGGSDGEQAASACARLLDMPNPPTAVVAASTGAARGVLRVAGERGTRIGEDLAVAVHDDPDWAEVVQPPLTTMTRPASELGQHAVRMLVARIGTPDGAAETVRVPRQLCRRRSCGC